MGSIISYLRILVIFKDYVYDLSSFALLHPGGINVIK